LKLYVKKGEGKMKEIKFGRRAVCLLFSLLLLLAGGRVWASSVAQADEVSYEVWMIDQSDTRPDGGGTLYIYQGDQVAGGDTAAATPEVIDLGSDVRTLCLNQTGTAPRRPHLMTLNSSHSYAVIGFVQTGHVLFMEAATRTPVACIDVGAQAHVAVPAPDETYVVVANTSAKRLHRINTDYETGTFVLDSGAEINLATCTTPSGAACQDPSLRPNTEPIYTFIDRSSQFTFVTLRTGGMFVLNSRATPMSIVAEYDRATITGNSGVGGVESGGKMYITGRAGARPGPLESYLYAFPISSFSSQPNPPNEPAPSVVFHNVFSNPLVDSDPRPATLTKHDRFIWIGDRSANRIMVVDTETDTLVNTIELAGDVSTDPTPDNIGIDPGGNRVFLSLRGPRPKSGNIAGVNNAVGSTPGLGVVRVERNGLSGTLHALAPVTNIVNGQEEADPHALQVRWIR
jgi:hypothetical protein